MSNILIYLRAVVLNLFERKFGGTLEGKKETVFAFFSIFKDLAAHLDKFDGTLVHRGTPVEKHCLRVWITRR